MRTFATPTDIALAPPTLTVGQPVHVNHRSTWLAATVRAVAAHHVAIDYTTPLALPLAGAVGIWAVRPADGILLKRIDQIRSGDEIANSDGSPQTVIAAWPGQAHTFTVALAGGEYATVPAGAVLRLLDTTPRVTVNGRRL